MRVIEPFSIVLAVITLGADAAFGQSEPSSSVSFTGGVASGASDTGAALSGFGLGPGPGFGSRSGTCPASAGGYWGVGALPTFYARRLGPLAFPRGGTWETRSFTDPALSVGGGFRFNVADRVMLRPDVRALVIFANGDTHTIATFAVHLGYRFRSVRRRSPPNRQAPVPWRHAVRRAVICGSP